MEGGIHVSDSHFASNLPSTTAAAIIGDTHPTSSAPLPPAPSSDEPAPLTPIQGTPSGGRGIHRISVYLNPFSSRSATKVSKNTENNVTPAIDIAENEDEDDLSGLPTNVPIADGEDTQTSISSPPLSEAPPLPSSKAAAAPGSKKKLSKKHSPNTTKPSRSISISTSLSPFSSSPSTTSAASKAANAIQSLLSGLPSPVSRAKALKVQKKVVPELMREDKARRAIEEVRLMEPFAASSAVDGEGASFLMEKVATETRVRVRVPSAVRAVCLDAPDEEIAAQFVTELEDILAEHPQVGAQLRAIVGGDLVALHTLLSKLKLIDILHSLPPASATDASEPNPTYSAQPIGSPTSHSPLSLPDLGHAATLSGALPSPQAVLDGVNDLASTLLALGLGDPAALLGRPANSGNNGQIAIPRLDEFLPHHKGVYPPKDRMSVITCELSYVLIEGGWDGADEFV